MSEFQSDPSTHNSHWDDLLISILSVNQYSLERTYDLLQGLHKQNITDPVSLAYWEPQKIEMRLRAGGYDRGSFMTRLFAERLSALGAFI
jgi:hypothetical protein